MAVVELIDPTGRLFGPRIIAQVDACLVSSPAAAQHHAKYDCMNPFVPAVDCNKTCESMLQGSGDPAQVDLAKRLKAGLEGREMVSIIVDDTSSVYASFGHT